MISQSCPRCGSTRIRSGYRPTPLWSKILFRYLLLCDKCNWEFTGFAVPGTVSSKPNKKGNNGNNILDTPKGQCLISSMACITPQYSKKAVSRAGDAELVNKPDTEEYEEALKIVNNGNNILDTPKGQCLISSMACITPQYSKKAVSRAGDALLVNKPDTEEYEEALKIVNNWRASHLYPMQKIKNTLERRAKRVDRDAITAQRLKRFSSIENKLKLLNKTRLGGMQDIGGCRAILETVNQINTLVEVYTEAQVKNTSTRPQWIDKDDYIETPKVTGYRSTHLIFQYQSSVESCKPYNGLKIEIQIRSRLQHYWATAVETAATFLGEPLKSGIGDQRWIRFFALTSSVFAKKENCELVPDTPTKSSELVSEIKELWDELQVETFLQSCVVITDASKKNSKIFDKYLLRLDSKEKKVNVQGYSKAQSVKAAKEYFTAEIESADKPEIQVVLVSVDKLSKLRVGYPNYFADTNEFIKAIKSALGRKI